MKISGQLVVFGLILQGVIAPDPFNQFMRQHYNQRGLQTPGTSGLSYTQYSAPGSTFTSGTPGQVSGISQNPGSNQQPISQGNTLTYGYETQRQTTGFQASPVPGPKLLPIQVTASTNNLITGVGTPIRTAAFQSSQTLNHKNSMTVSGPSSQTSNQPQSGLNQTPSGLASSQQPLYPGNTLTFGFETQKQTAGFQITPIPGPRLLPLQASLQKNNQLPGVGMKRHTSRVQSSQTPSSNSLPPVGSVSRNTLTLSRTPQQTSNHLSGPPQLPSGAAKPQSTNQAQPMRSLMMTPTQPKSRPPQLPTGAAQPKTANPAQPLRSLMMPPTQPQTQPSGQYVQTVSGSDPPMQTRLQANRTVAGKLYPGSVKTISQTTLTSAAAQVLTTGAQALPKGTKKLSKGLQSLPTGRQQLLKATQQLPTGIHHLKTGTQSLLRRAQTFQPGTQFSPALAHHTGPKPHATNPRPVLSSVLQKSILTMGNVPQTHSPQSSKRSQALHTDSNFFLPPLPQANMQLPLGAAKPSPVFSQQINTAVQTLPSYSSPPLTYNPSRLEKWAIKSYTDDSVAKPRTLKRKSYIQLIAKRRRALANQQLFQALFIQPSATNVHPKLDRAMPDFLTLNAARDLDCETIPEVRGLDVHKYQPMGCDDDKCPPGKECRTLRGVGMCCPPSVTSQAIRTKSNVGKFEHLGLV